MWSGAESPLETLECLGGTASVLKPKNKHTRGTRLAKRNITLLGK